MVALFRGVASLANADAGPAPPRTRNLEASQVVLWIHSGRSTRPIDPAMMFGRTLVMSKALRISWASSCIHATENSTETPSNTFAESSTATTKQLILQTFSTSDLSANQRYPAHPAAERFSKKGPQCGGEASGVAG